MVVLASMVAFNVHPLLWQEKLGMSVFVFFKGYNLLNEFRLAESRGVRVVEGSEPDLVAYRVNPSLHLRKSLR